MIRKAARLSWAARETFRPRSFAASTATSRESALSLAGCAAGAAFADRRCQGVSSQADRHQITAASVAARRRIRRLTRPLFGLLGPGVTGRTRRPTNRSSVALSVARRSALAAAAAAVLVSGSAAQPRAMASRPPRSSVERHVAAWAPPELGRLRGSGGR